MRPSPTATSRSQDFDFLECPCRPWQAVALTLKSSQVRTSYLGAQATGSSRVQPGPAGSSRVYRLLQFPQPFAVKLHPSVPAFDKPSASGSRDFPAGFGQHGTLAEKKNAAFSVLSKTWLCLNWHENRGVPEHDVHGLCCEKNCL